MKEDCHFVEKQALSVRTARSWNNGKINKKIDSSNAGELLAPSTSTEINKCITNADSTPGSDTSTSFESGVLNSSQLG